MAVDDNSYSNHKGMTKKEIDEMIAWLMDNPNNLNGKTAYYLTKVRHSYFE